MTGKHTRNSAIVLGTEVNGMGVIRSLGRLGVKCGAIHAHSRGDHAIHSRYLAATRGIVPAVAFEDLLAACDELARRLGGEPCVLIATTDKYAQLLCENQAVLSERYLLRCPDERTHDAFLDKWKTAAICGDNGILIPDTFCPRDLPELEELAPRLKFPAIVKPRYTFEEFPGKNAVFDEPHGLLQFFRDNGVIGRAVIQRIVPSGDGDILVTATYSGADGRVRAMYSGRKIRQFLPDYGATCFGISERHPELEERSRRFLDGIGYKGFAALEFSRSREDGRAYFLELNTRTYLHNQLFADAGVDLTQVGYLEMVGRSADDRLVPQREGLIWLDFRRDMASMRIKRRQGRITLWRWLASILKARSFAYWSWRDPLPFLVACTWRTREFSSNALRRLARGAA